MKNKLLMAAAIAMSTFLYSCENADSPDNKNATLTVNLTDDPIDAIDSVLIDIQDVRLKLATDTSEAGWKSMTTNKGIYDLLLLQNGKDTAIARDVIPQGTLKEIRLILGSNNRVIDTAGVSHNLTIPSGSESGLKIKLNKQIDAETEELLLDFDAGMSIKKENDGYKLRPVIKVME